MMKEYHKIQSVYKRDEETHKFRIGDYSMDEFEYLKDNMWEWTEKVDGTNIRVMWNKETGEVKFGGKTDSAQMPVKLMEKLQSLFTPEKFAELPSLCLYGEGYGAKIQKGGGNYIKDGVDFVLFDVLVGEWWLYRGGVNDIARKLGILSVPVIGRGSLIEAVEFVREGFKSIWGDFNAEGIVLRPIVELKTRSGHRIITKIKEKDF